MELCAFCDLMGPVILKERCSPGTMPPSPLGRVKVINTWVESLSSKAELLFSFPETELDNATPF